MRPQSEYEMEWEYEWEAAPEFEYEYEGEYELAPMLRRAAAVAARAAQRAPVSPYNQRTPNPIAGSPLGNVLADLMNAMQQREYEGEFEYEGEVNPLRRVYPDALMEHIGHMAAESESEAEAEAFIGALIPLAARALPAIARAVAPAVTRTLARAAPSLTRGAMAAARTLHRNPSTRRMLRNMPSAVRRTVQTVARQSAQGQRVTPRQALNVLGRQTYRLIADPRQRQQAMRRSNALDQRYHRVSNQQNPLIRGVRRPMPTYTSGSGMPPQYEPVDDGFGTDGAPSGADAGMFVNDGHICR